jgi:L-rhamnose-H+ transport protein
MGMGSWLALLAAGVMNGSFAVPMKTARSWSFYHIWGLFSFLAMLIIPFAWVVLSIPGCLQIIGAIPLAGLCKLTLLGFLWGIAALLYGAAVELLGVAVGVSILLGLSIVIGAVIPRITSGAALVTTPRDVVFFCGLLITVAGVIVCAWAGRSETGLRSAAQFRKGLVIAILGGIGSPLLNIGIQYGISLLKALPHSLSERNGSATQWVAWALFLAAAAIVQVGYCLSRVMQKGELSAFSSPDAGGEFGRVVLMSIAWSVSIFLYGEAVAHLGRYGASIGWPIFMALIVLTSNAWGVILGEWRNRPKRAFYRMLAGSLLLISATFLIGQAG